MRGYSRPAWWLTPSARSIWAAAAIIVLVWLLLALLAVRLLFEAIER
jgi:hypothetical protein